MPNFLERKLRANVPRGVNADRYVYGAMNNMGAMRGNKETAKGKAIQRKHDKKQSRNGAKRVHRGVTDLL